MKALQDAVMETEGAPTGKKLRFRVWRGQMMDRSRSSDTYVGGDAYGFSSNVVVESTLWVRRADGKEEVIRLGGDTIPFRIGSNLEVVEAATPRGAECWLYLKNLDTGQLEERGPSRWRRSSFSRYIGCYSRHMGVRRNVLGAFTRGTLRSWLCGIAGFVLCAGLLVQFASASPPEDLEDIMTQRGGAVLVLGFFLLHHLLVRIPSVQRADRRWKRIMKHGRGLLSGPVESVASAGRG